MGARKRIISDIKYFLNKTGITEKKLGWRAAEDSSIVVRLFDGANIRTDKFDALYEYMNKLCPEIVNPCNQGEERDVN